MADRDAYLTDPAARDVPVEMLLDRERLASLAARIDPARASARRPRPTRRGGGTIFLATVDGDGNAVSLIESNYLGFGSGVVDPEDRRPLPEPGQLLQPGSRSPERPRAAQADAPHAAPRDAVPGRPGRAVDRGRLDGRRRPAADPRPVRECRRRRRPRYPDSHRRAPLLHRAGRPLRAHRRPSGWSRGMRPARRTRCAHSVTTWRRPRRSTRASATNMRSSSWAGGPAAHDGSVVAATDPRSAGLPAVW